MDIWFIRCNGETAHNQPGTGLYIPGEPPKYPDREFNYREECLQHGFARVGWPAAGDLRDPYWLSRARETYRGMMRPHHERYLEQFCTIQPGDLVILPWKNYHVHLGLVVPPRRFRSGQIHSTAYYYHYDITAREWYENAHRIDVDWAKDSEQDFRTFCMPEIGGLWRRGFGCVKADEPRIAIERLAITAQLIP